MVVRRPHNSSAAVALACALLVGACSGGSGKTKQKSEPDVGPTQHHDAGHTEPTWVKQTIGSGDVGLMPELAVSGDDEVGVAFFGTQPTDGGPCTETGSQDPPTKMFWKVQYASIAAADVDQGNWQIEDVTDVLSLSQPRGLDLAFAPDGTPSVTTMTGDPIQQPPYCGANDVGLLTRNGAGDWSLQTAVTTSGDAATGEPASDYGQVVGYWPALTYDSSGGAFIAYKDVHAGGLQGDDRKRADLELAHQAGGWTASPVDYGRGAGDFNAIAVDSQDRPIIAYYDPVESTTAQLGVWVARPAADGQSFDTVQLFNQATERGPSIVVDPDDDLPRVLFYNSQEGYPQLATQTSESDFGSIGSGWQLDDIGDARYDEGYDASLAVSPSGHLAAVYYRCTKATSGPGNCDAADDALVFAWEDAGDWTREVVDEGSEGFCGRHPSLAFDSTGYAHIAYECEKLVDGELQTQLKYARRKPL